MFGTDIGRVSQPTPIKGDSVSQKVKQIVFVSESKLPFLCKLVPLLIITKTSNDGYEIEDATVADDESFVDVQGPAKFANLLASL